ncbi:TlpA family protein disulfide reductase [Pedobacter borealis]|uniref:TlpA family protein disulfide reductase n=1 Tax=Pedobacter borealis TaxID=475254 RepID=UPI00049301FE|nr:TlpA disulfide reductase family protein [Pedobacter borealis]
MKQLFTIVALMVLNSFAFAQTTEIRGVLKPNINKVVYLFQVEDGETKLVKSVKLAEDGAFILSFDPSYEGFYMIGGFTALAGQFPLYLKKGDTVTVRIENGFMEFSDKLTIENRLLGGWQGYKLSSPSLAPSSAESFDAYLKVIPTKHNNSFNQLVKSFMIFDFDYSRFIYLKRNPNEGSSILYKNLIVKDKFIDDAVLSYPKGKELITLYADYAASIDKSRSAIDFLTTDRQKGLYIFGKEAPNLKSYEIYEQFMNKYGKYFQSPGLKAKVEALGAKLYNATPGRKGSNFSFPDQDGKMVSLSDFKGKVVLVDVWATFCGPCLALVPALNKLEAELHDQKDIVFIGVAQDGPRGKATWLKLIKERQMGGIQLFVGGGNNVLAKDYKIKVMPRYLIFDRQGNVVTAEAPFPSSPELKKLLLAEISK